MPKESKDLTKGSHELGLAVMDCRSLVGEQTMPKPAHSFLKPALPRDNRAVTLLQESEDTGRELVRKNDNFLYPQKKVYVTFPEPKLKP